MASRITVTNWHKHQHYKDRNPPWIKLATDTFQDYEFGRLHDASKLLAICIWTLASRSKDGSVPNDFQYIKRQCNLSDFVTEAHLKQLISEGFMTVASDVLAPCKQNAIPETEGETEGETDTQKGRDDCLEPYFEEVWAARWGRGSAANPKTPALKAYKAAIKKGATHPEILNAVKQRYGVSKAGTEYAPQLATWLNQERWKEEAPPPAEKPTDGRLVRSWM